MPKTYFGFGISDSMFPLHCGVSRRPLTPNDVRLRLAAGGVLMCLNPSHKPTCDAAIGLFALPITIPERAASVSLSIGDSVIVMSVRGLPRLEGRHEYTQEEINGASFVFGEWVVVG